MALLNAANNLGPNIVEYTDFYNVSLDHMDLMSEYYTWQNPDRPGQFSYCQVIGVYLKDYSRSSHSAYSFSYKKTRIK